MAGDHEKKPCAYKENGPGHGLNRGPVHYVAANHSDVCSRGKWNHINEVNHPSPSASFSDLGLISNASEEKKTNDVLERTRRSRGRLRRVRSHALRRRLRPCANLWPPASAVGGDLLLHLLLRRRLRQAAVLLRICLLGLRRRRLRGARLRLLQDQAAAGLWLPAPAGGRGRWIRRLRWLRRPSPRTQAWL